MKIVHVDSVVVTYRYEDNEKRIRNTHHDWTAKNYLLVRVVASDGSFGLGEAYLDSAGAPKVIQSLLEEEIVPRIRGEDPRHIERIRAKIAKRFSLGGITVAAGIAMGAVDIALWDLLGKHTGQPLYRLLGGHADRASVYGSGGMYGSTVTPESLAREMATAVHLGYGGVKIKGAGAPLEEDVARVAAIRAALGPSARIMVDAMFVLDVPQAIRLARALEPYNLHFLEAPTARSDIRGWRAIREATSIPLAGPELEGSTDIMREFLLGDAVHYLQYDLTLANGISHGKELAAFARLFYRKVTLHCSGSAIGMVASAHLAAALPNCNSVEVHLLHQGLHEHMWAAGFRLDNGFLVLPDRPGLGFDVDFDKLMAEHRA